MIEKIKEWYEQKILGMKPIDKKSRHYGVCILCNSEGDVERHHVFPKCMGIVTKNEYTRVGELKKYKLKKRRLMVKAENLVVDLCPLCHVKVHMHFKNYKMIYK
jgi:hypothetical protein